MVSSVLSMITILLLGAVACEDDPPEIPENITIAIIHILEDDDFSKVVAPLLDSGVRAKRSIGHGYIPPQVAVRQGFPSPVVDQVDIPTPVPFPVEGAFPDPIYPVNRFGTVVRNINNGVLGTSGAINTRYLGQGPYGSFVNNGAVTNDLGGPVSNYGTVDRINSGPVTNFISYFTPGSLSVRSGEIVRDYYAQGSYDTALRYFRALQPQRVTYATNGFQGYNGFYTTGRNYYNLAVCDGCYDGFSGIQVRSNVQPYNFLERRFLFVPEFNSNVYRSTGCVTSCNGGF